ncbi:MAG TPA: hypothetical protein DEB40_12095 [Elusimicrobia bacterium]|nr:hypothetical protein [Elusimicrobiota bacterium]HBT62475.1 hypothetical protein [Elusimicrobiota bacterium]
MFRPCQQNQEFLLPPSLIDFIAKNHPARMINDLVDRLDRTMAATGSRMNWRGGRIGWQRSRRPERRWRSGNTGTIPASLSTRRSRFLLRTM